MENARKYDRCKDGRPDMNAATVKVKDVVCLLTTLIIVEESFRVAELSGGTKERLGLKTNARP